MGCSRPGNASDESNGPVAATVTTFRGWPDPTKTDWEGLIKKAHPQTQPNAIFNQAESARKIARSEIWQVIDQTATPSSGTKWRIEARIQGLSPDRNPEQIPVREGSRVSEGIRRRSLERPFCAQMAA